MAPGIYHANPHLDELRDGPAVMRYVITLARIERVYAWLTERQDQVFSDVDAGEVHGVYLRLETWERQADKAEERLAIAPLTRARLGLDLIAAKRATLSDFIGGEGSEAA